MPTTPFNGWHYPAASDPPDAPGAIYTLATDLDTAFAHGIWTPTLGGGAALGTSGGTDGTYQRIGLMAVVQGRIVFGTSATFGSGSATVGGIPYGMDYVHSTGYGYWKPISGSKIPLLFEALSNGGEFYIRPISSNGTSLATLQAATSLPAPATGDQITFTLNLTVA